MPTPSAPAVKARSSVSASEPCSSRAARRSQCRPHRRLALALLGAHQEQVGDVGDRDEQDEAHGAQQHPECDAHVADQLVLEGHDPGVHAGVVEVARDPRRIDRILAEARDRGTRSPAPGPRG